jgi:hypothetical protein
LQGIIVISSTAELGGDFIKSDVLDELQIVAIAKKEG